MKNLNLKEDLDEDDLDLSEDEGHFDYDEAEDDGTLDELLDQSGELIREAADNLGYSNFEWEDSTQGSEGQWDFWIDGDEEGQRLHATCDFSDTWVTTPEAAENLLSGLDWEPEEDLDEDLKEEKINIDYVVSLFGDDSHYYKEDGNAVKLSPDISGATKFNKKKDISILDIVKDVCEYSLKYMPEDEVASLFDLDTVEEVYEKDEDYFINSGLVKIITVYKNKKINLPESLEEAKEEHHDLAAEEESLAEETHAKYAKPEGDRVAAYNNALKYAKKENKPFIYGYTDRNGKFFALNQPIKCTDLKKQTADFKTKYTRCNVVDVAYPKIIEDYDPTREYSYDELLDLADYYSENPDDSIDYNLVDELGNTDLSESISPYDEKKNSVMEYYNKVKSWDSSNAKNRTSCKYNVDIGLLNEWIDEQDKEAKQLNENEVKN